MRRELQQYAQHTRHSTTINLLYRHTTSKKCLNLSFRKIHSNLLEKITCRPMELQWVQKMVVALANIFMPKIETKMISQSKTKPIEWKRFIDDIFSLWDVTKRKLTCSLNKLTNSILLLNLRPKFQRTRLAFSTQ